MAATILRQTLIMLILIFFGISCSKLKIISKEANADLSKLVLQVVNPVVIFMSYQTSYDSQLVRNLLITFGLSILSMAIVILFATVFIRRKDGRDFEVERFSAIYSNCGFMGIPLIQALFGLEGVFYLTAYITVFNLLVWTHGIVLISGQRSLKGFLKVLRSPVIIAIFLGITTFFLRIRLPQIPSDALTFISNLNTPLAMIVSGVTMADADVLKVLKNGRVYYICLLKLVILPSIAIAVLSLFDPDPLLLSIVGIAAAAPPAAMCTLLSIQYKRNSLYASEIFTAGTILSVIFLPVIAEITEFFTKI